MEQEKPLADNASADLKAVVRSAIEEFLHAQQSKTEPAYKTELVEERRRRETLERRVNELVEENRKSRQIAEEVERGSAIRSELQRLGVSKIDLAFKAVKDDIARSEDGRLFARTDAGEVTMRDYLTRFVTDNPELLPGRIQGGSGAGATHAQPAFTATVDIDKIRPGMSAEEMDKIRQEIARVAKQTMRGL